jgi:hypothetical protein
VFSLFDPGGLGRIAQPTLTSVGAATGTCGRPPPHAEAADIPSRDHNLAVGGEVFKARALAFLERRA